MGTQQSERLEFQAETRQLLDLMIHSLYRHKEIFLRELISNASDALDKVRFLAVTEPQILKDDDHLHVRLEGDAEDRTLMIADNGVGMSRDDLASNLGTIARSGTREFLKQMRAADDDKGGLPDLIGQFGVGFYSAFMVADEVVVDTRRYDSDQGYRWRSRGDGTYTIEEIEKPDRGTTIVLHLKERSEGDDAYRDFTQEWTLRETIKKYSDFVAYPIEMEVEREEGEGDDKKTVTRVEVLNSMRPLWTRAAADVKKEEYDEFYRHLTKDWEAPAKTIHFRAEGTLEYTALLYLPSHRPMFEPDPKPKSRLSLYVKRVFIMDDCEELLPPWLRFVRGLVDSNDLPLNVSRETLQHNRQMTPIRKRLTAKVLDTLKSMLADDREEYDKFWGDFGPVLKEGIYYDDENKQTVAGVSLFASTKGDELTTLHDYVERMPFAQKEIYYLAGADRRSLKASPHLEAFAKKGFEVLFLTDPVDEFALQRLTEFEGKPLKSIERGQVELEDDEQEKEKREEKQKELKPLLERVKSALDEQVSEVRFSNRLTDSAAVLVTGEHDLTPQMERVLRDARQEVPQSKRILELNPDHALVARLNEHESDDDFSGYCELLYGQALLAEGSSLPDPQRFNRLLIDLMVKKA